MVLRIVCFTLGVVFFACVAAHAPAQTLYGIASSGELLEIDETPGAATVIGDTGLLRPGGLTYDADTGVMYALDSGVGEIFIIDPAGATATSLPSPVSLSGLESLASRAADGFLYTVSMGPLPVPELYRIDPATGAPTAAGGTVGSAAITGTCGAAIRRRALCRW